MNGTLPSREEVAKYFEYDPETGLLTRLRKMGSQAAGAIVSNRSLTGRVRVTFMYRAFLAHRVIWLLATGNWPDGDIDHINGDPADNRIANLRVVDRRTNSENKRRARSDNKLGVQGVSRYGGSYRAHIQVGAKRKHLGTFSTPEMAHSAYIEAKRQLHKGNTL